MDCLSAIFAVLGSLFAGIVGNVVAHDFCQFTPKLCQRFITRAVKVLPKPEQQERYSEEWLAHLGECTGVIEQYKHAATCILGARRLRRATLCTISFKKARFEFDRQGVIDLEPPTALAITYFLAAFSLKMASRLIRGKSNSNRLPVIGLFIFTFCATIYNCRKYGRINNKQLNTVVQHALRAIRQKHNATLILDGKRIDFAKTIQSASQTNRIPNS